MILADYSALDAAGLNLHAVFTLDRLPAGLRDSLDGERRYRQLILIGNGGRALWTAIEAEGITSDNPIDEFSVRRVEAWLAAYASGRRYQIVYPGDRPIGLQTLGELAGWHFDSPFMVGINARWGTWFAYRVAVLADTEFSEAEFAEAELADSASEPAAVAVSAGESTRATSTASPCAACRQRPCVDACPAQAIGDAGFELQRCVAYRRRPGSACRLACLARLACPVRQELRYGDEQMRHSYATSLRMIERMSDETFSSAD